jgi:hypothetical protein
VCGGKRTEVDQREAVCMGHGRAVGDKNSKSSRARPGEEGTQRSWGLGKGTVYGPMCVNPMKMTNIRETNDS